MKYYLDWHWLNRFRRPCPRCPGAHGVEIYERVCCFPDCAPFAWIVWWWRARSELWNLEDCFGNFVRRRRDIEIHCIAWGAVLFLWAVVAIAFFTVQ